ncbi:MAG: hypothetical protein KJN89_06615 [Gammaproteobacteria bacterium]|nr:hypothetical protein [Gammaproteobacteria bacterium]NNJ50030.1 hypothetical protein [Gammaproteobacteria bacterium]
MKKYITVFLCFAISLLGAGSLYGQKIVLSGANSPGFKFSTTPAGALADPVQPVIHYQQNISMLAGIDDRPTLSVYGDGRVHVHYPEYMKKAGDYEMKLSEDEVAGLVQSLHKDGVLEFDQDKVKAKIRSERKALRESGQLYAISDAMETVVDIRLDEYQRDKSSASIKNFHKRFKWKNIEQQALRFNQQRELVDAHSSVKNLQRLMQDSRLTKQGR